VSFNEFAINHGFLKIRVTSLCCLVLNGLKELISHIEDNHILVLLVKACEVQMALLNLETPQSVERLLVDHIDYLNKVFALSLLLLRLQQESHLGPMHRSIVVIGAIFESKQIVGSRHLHHNVARKLYLHLSG
jgi:hypothetical protein